MPIAGLIIDQIAVDDDPEGTLRRLNGLLHGYFKTHPKTAEEIERLVARVLREAPANDLRDAVVKRIRNHEITN